MEHTPATTTCMQTQPCINHFLAAALKRFLCFIRCLNIFCWLLLHILIYLNEKAETKWSRKSLKHVKEMYRGKHFQCSALTFGEEKRTCGCGASISFSSFSYGNIEQHEKLFVCWWKQEKKLIQLWADSRKTELRRFRIRIRSKEVQYLDSKLILSRHVAKFLLLSSRIIKAKWFSDSWAVKLVSEKVF